MSVKKDLYGIPDRYGTKYLSFQNRLEFYQTKYNSLKETRVAHKAEIQNLKNMKQSTVNVMDFKKEEINKKMKNEIFRLKEESKRHEESQANENKKIGEGCEGVQELANANDDLLEGKSLLFYFLEVKDRVVFLERHFGPDLKNEKIQQKK